ncbi:rubredoxin [Gaoshiqia sp. Z1-71]|uniref:rubredoxin n=1 Tax=Gaoshiqia hydrogeniformans TaxID=3290090 RepID=UPI003BF831D3
MSRSKQLYRILNKGGVLSPALLSKILKVAEDAGNTHVFLGSRQDILFFLPETASETQLHNEGFSVYKRSSGIQNVVSSYVCVDMLPSTNWVHSGTYLNVLDQFTFHHSLRVNLVDPRQNLVPLFYGQLNFVASETPNYWHLYLNLQAGKSPQCWDGLIFTDDIARFAQTLEQLIIGQNIKSQEKLKEKMAGSTLQKNTLETTAKLILPEGFFPYYEGLNKIDGKDLYWAGFYWRNNQYPIPFLKEICELCQRTNLVKISFTPWKTFLIKDIEAKDKIYWEELIGRYGINMRHSSFELNWHLPLLDQQALKLKRYLVAGFDQFDIRTFGLSFAILNKDGERFTSVVIRSKGWLPFLGRFDFTRTYSVEYAYDFNPNNNHYVAYATNLGKNELPQTLRELSKRYYARLFVQHKWGQIPKQVQPGHTQRVVWQCPDCLTVYDDRYGDLLARIKEGVPFGLLPDSYCCQVCETPKSAFTWLELTEPVGI